MKAYEAEKVALDLLVTRVWEDNKAGKDKKVVLAELDSRVTLVNKDAKDQREAVQDSILPGKVTNTPLQRLYQGIVVIKLIFIRYFIRKSLYLQISEGWHCLLW
jgi:hypothetical protein